MAAHRSIVRFEPSPAKAHNPELVTGALRVFLGKQFNSDLVFAWSKVTCQDRGLAITAPGLVKPSFSDYGRLVVHANTGLAYRPADSTTTKSGCCESKSRLARNAP